jgi:DNA-binding NarL/FixJ family response regulator
VAVFEGEFVGRSRELAACLDRTALVTFVEGRPGMGKTRLLAEAARRAPGPVAVVYATEPGCGGSLGFTRRLLEALEGVTGGDPLSGARPLGAFGDGEALVVVDDVHRVDERSLRLLASLVRRPQGGCRLLLSARDQQIPAALTSLLRTAGTPARYLTLPAFTEDEVARLLPGHHAAGRERIAAAAEGVPLYLLLLAELPPHQWPGPGDLPGSGDRPMLPLERALFAEVFALAEPDRLVAQAAACCGPAIDVDLVRAMTALDEAGVSPAVERLLRRGVLVDGDTGLRFRHPLVRVAAHRLAGRGWAAAAHHRAAGYLRELDAPLTVRAYHLEKSLRRHDLVSVGELAVAAEEVLDTDPAASARWLAAALRHLPERLRGGHEHLRLSVLHARALMWSGQPDAARALLIGLTSSPEVLALLSRCEHALGRTRRARAIAEAAIAASDVTDARAQLELAHLELLDGDTAGAQERLRRLAAEPDHGPAVQAAMSALTAFGLAYTGRTAEALRACRAAADGFDLLDDSQLRAVLDIVPELCWTSSVLDQDRRALALLDRARHVTEASGLRHGLPLLHSVRGHVLYKLGRLVEAAEAADEAEAAAVRFGHQDVLSVAGAIRLRVLVAAGDRVAAEQQWRTVDKLSRPAVEWWRQTVEQVLAEASFELGMFPGAVEPPPGRGADPLRASTSAHQCLVALAGGAPAEARRSAAEAVRQATATGLGSQLGTAILARAACAMAEDDLAAALADATAAAVAFGRASMPVQRGRAILLAAQVLGRQGDFDAATRRIAEARAVFRCADASTLLHEATKVQRQLAGGRKLRPSTTGERNLSRRELQVAEMVARGLATKEIAAELFLSPRTVDTHVGHVLRKLDLTSRAGIAHRLPT